MAGFSGSDRFLRIKDVVQSTGLSRSYIYQLSGCGEFPQPIKLGIKASAWLESEVEEWKRSRVKGSRATSSNFGG
ncbi:AlpA family transcriptional regulator [Halioxenophilus sp. WMMB6]|uniref:helix-turn-helix transcriptional regulator n=1 Tax=Halioxenophilus sp. WMMB6 TaxID=3073815 RepID=UPI00295F5A44|nr:AlpA family transcriptional regulator [Halioxenophilus sp. WMMB6]